MRFLAHDSPRLGAPPDRPSRIIDMKVQLANLVMYFYRPTIWKWTRFHGVNFEEVLVIHAMCYQTGYVEDPAGVNRAGRIPVVLLVSEKS
jgi:hypothetical protein